MNKLRPCKSFLGWLTAGLDFGNSKVSCLQIFEMQVDSQSDNVRVVVRCRPMNEKEVAGGCGLAVNVEENRGIITVKNTGARSGEPPKQFTYDRVFGVDTKQVDVYNDAARPIVNCVLEGYNGKNDKKKFSLMNFYLLSGTFRTVRNFNILTARGFYNSP